MPVDPNKARVAVDYIADDGLHYRYVTSHNHAIAAGGVTPTSQRPIPSRWVPRHILGVKINATAPDQHARLIIGDKTAGLWVGTVNTFTIAGLGTFDVTGRIGEKRSLGAVDWDGVATPNNGRVNVRYQGDDGNFYLVTMSRSHASAVSAPVPVGGELAFPKIWTPRHYDCKAIDPAGADQKCRLVEPNPAAAAWVADTQFAFTVLGLGDTHFENTGRIDEKRHRGAPAL